MASTQKYDSLNDRDQSVNSAKKLSFNAEKEQLDTNGNSKQNSSVTVPSSELFVLLIKDAIYGYIFWSVFQALSAMIWFYPLNELEISGYEAFAAVWLSPFICIIPGVHAFLQQKWVLILLRLISVCSVASFQAPTTLIRLILLATGAGVSMLVLAATLWNSDKLVRYRTFWGLILGLHAFLASRVWFVTFAPAWWDNQSNSIVIACGVISALGYSLEEASPQVQVKQQSPVNHWLPSGVGLGSLLCLTHMCFGEASLITRWTVKGYPETGPSPLPWGSLVLLCLSLGTAVQIKAVLAIPVTLAATVSFYFLLLFPDPWLAFYAGCCLAFLTMTLWPAVIDVCTQSNPALCLTVASLTYIIQILFWVWTVAFNFVPYGELTREHTDWVIACIMAGILLLFIFSKASQESFTTVYTRMEDELVPALGHYLKVVFLIFLVSQVGMMKRLSKYKPGSEVKSNPKIFTAGIWTYHFGYDNKGWPSMERAATMINNTGVDVITLLESDASKPFLGNNDLASWLAEKLNFYVDFGPSTKDHTWGNLILSKYPIVKSQHHLLPSPHGELAPAITASINVSGTLVNFVVTHMGNDRDVVDRNLQAEFLAKELRQSVDPAVFLGYVTSPPGSENYWRLIKDGKVKDIDPTDQDRWCEYIMYKKLIRRGYARISHGGLSDTEIQLGTFQIPEDPVNYKDKKKVTTSPTKHNIDKSVLFNNVFGNYYPGHGYFDHHGFHMGTPKYFYND
ncbi:PGAP2-interacting protein-like [Physella acuta]|uniref:PGAP2-interacting protein-like n=1 Tax=Physella acuta TaxID=109671 RepID=UPI0027DE54A9|nr:PGAP2-interacting protein-like [Physella acuta]